MNKNIVAPLPGIILEILVAPGDYVEPGQAVVVLEAMKMENELQVEFAGVVSMVNVSVCDSVLAGTVIITID